jgi:hypothetical protein
LWKPPALLKVTLSPTWIVSCAGAKRLLLTVTM